MKNLYDFMEDTKSILGLWIATKCNDPSMFTLVHDQLEHEAQVYDNSLVFNTLEERDCKYDSRNRMHLSSTGTIPCGGFFLHDDVHFSTYYKDKNRREVLPKHNVNYNTDARNGVAGSYDVPELDLRNVEEMFFQYQTIHDNVILHSSLFTLYMDEYYQDTRCQMYARFSTANLAYNDMLQNQKIKDHVQKYHDDFMNKIKGIL